MSKKPVKKFNVVGVECHAITVKKTVINCGRVEGGGRIRLVLEDGEWVYEGPATEQAFRIAGHVIEAYIASNT